MVGDAACRLLTGHWWWCVAHGPFLQPACCVLLGGGGVVVVGDEKVCVRKVGKPPTPVWLARNFGFKVARCS